MHGQTLLRRRKQQERHEGHDMSAASGTHVARIIPFPGERKAEPRPIRDGETRGAVLFFTGIRYERMPEDREHSAPKPAPTRRKRV